MITLIRQCLVDRADVGMIQGGRCSRLTVKPSAVVTCWHILNLLGLDQRPPLRQGTENTDGDRD